MALTHKQNLPVEFVRYEEANAHSSGEADISVTKLIDSAQIARLQSEHEVDEDISEGIMRLLGTAVHNVLEVGCEGMENVISEERFFREHDGYIISGQCDKLTLKPSGKYKLTDYKVTSAQSVMYNPKGKDDWVS